MSGYSCVFLHVKDNFLGLSGNKKTNKTHLLCFSFFSPKSWFKSHKIVLSISIILNHSHIYFLYFFQRRSTDGWLRIGEWEAVECNYVIQVSEAQVENL